MKKKPAPPPAPICNHDQRDQPVGAFLPEKLKGQLIDCPNCGGTIIAAPKDEAMTSIPTFDTNCWWHLDPDPAPVRCRDPVVTYYRGSWHTGHHTWGGYKSCRHQFHTCPPDTAPGGFSHAPTLF